MSPMHDFQALTQVAPDTQGTSHSLLRTPLFGSAVPRRQRTGKLKSLRGFMQLAGQTRLAVACEIDRLLLSNISYRFSLDTVHLQLALRDLAPRGMKQHVGCVSGMLRCVPQCLLLP